jgi:hypothetical protein
MQSTQSRIFHQFYEVQVKKIVCVSLVNLLVAAAKKEKLREETAVNYWILVIIDSISDI